MVDLKEFDMASYFRFRDKELAQERASGKHKSKKCVLPREDEKEEPEAEEQKINKISFSLKSKDEYSFLCPYHNAPFSVRGRLYKTIQHYYQVSILS